MGTAKLLIDTNVILDVLCNRAGFVASSSLVWKLCETGKAEGYISALSVPNIVYILRKELDPEKTKRVVTQLLMIFRVIELTSDDLLSATEMYLSDYGDALQMVCAERIKADRIISRNVRDFKDSPVASVTPDAFVGEL